MTDPRDRDQTPHQDDGLADLLHDAVSDVEPHDRLAAIRQQTQEPAMSASPRRPWALAALGAAAAVLVAAGAVAAVGQRGSDDAPPVASSDTASTEPSAEPASPTEEPSASEPTGDTTTTPPLEVTSTPSAQQVTVPVYYVTDTEQDGPRLVREFHRVETVEGDPFAAALRELSRAAPDDDAYYSLLPRAELADVSFDGIGASGTIAVRTPNGDWEGPQPGLGDREAELAIQQVVWTLQGVAQARARVLFLDPEGRPLSTVLGVDVSGGVTHAPALETLNLVNITSPAQGEVVSGDTLTVTGVVNAFEGSGPCALIAGGEEVAVVPYQAEGWMEDRLFPFTVELPLADAGTGDVLVRCSTEDPSGGTEGSGSFTDDKLITVE